MTLAIMQPYFFPYIGYWQLLCAANTFVIYDDVNFIKRGYINRNSILVGNKAQRITLEVIGASSNKLINDVQVGNNAKKLLKGIDQAYRKAPEYEKVFPLIQSILENPEKNIAKFLGNSLQKIADYLEINTKVIYSSSLEKDNSLKAQDKVLDICQRLRTSHYINTIGGQVLYSKDAFESKGIELNFIKTELMEYKQFGNEFVPYLSIIDIMMFNSVDNIKEMLNRYELI
ncbi:MAG: WbqC family protein [Candidatus Caldatribacteriota bacterium]|nr:WbqC family protein [Candidatus Caldatribacteriota bacterium]